MFANLFLQKYFGQNVGLGGLRDFGADLAEEWGVLSNEEVDRRFSHRECRDTPITFRMVITHSERSYSECSGRGHT